MLDAAFDAGRVLSALFLIFLYIRGRRVPSKLVWVQAVLQGWFLLLTYMRNPERLWGVVISTVSILTVACAVDLFSARPAMLTRGLMGIMEWLIYGNLLSIILTYPHGLYISVGHGQHCYFLGYRNGFFQYALLAILAAMLYSHIEKKKVRPLCLIAASYLCILITWSATSVAALMAVSVLIIIPSQKLRRWVTFPRVFGGAMAVNLAITGLCRAVYFPVCFGGAVCHFYRGSISDSADMRTYDVSLSRRKIRLRPWSDYPPSAFCHKTREPCHELKILLET
ncbi:MAG: hypothetical protein HFF57_03400 [Lawsonibacter sp.]|nr:hypothetical protein [Lawsonibacter sp.]